MVCKSNYFVLLRWLVFELALVFYDIMYQVLLVVPNSLVSNVLVNLVVYGKTMECWLLNQNTVVVLIW